MPIRPKDLLKCNKDLLHITNKVIEKVKGNDVSVRWPTELCLESTTVCNSHCRFCTHDEMIRSGGKPHKHLIYDRSLGYLEWMDGMVKLNGINDAEISFSAVGLGEPLLCPDFFKINARARELWPGAHITMNTNCHALDDEAATNILNGPFDQVTLSMGYIDPDVRNEMYGVKRYDQAVENIDRFFRMKGKNGPRVVIHVFDVPENHKLPFKHIKRWSNLMGKRDAFQIRDYMSLVDGDFTSKAGKPLLPAVERHGDRHRGLRLSLLYLGLARGRQSHLNRAYNRTAGDGPAAPGFDQGHATCRQVQSGLFTMRDSPSEPGLWAGGHGEIGQGAIH